MRYTLKVKKLKCIETDGKSDTFSISLEGSTPTGLALTLTINADSQAELKKRVPTATGSLVEMELFNITYGDITGYSQTVAAPAPVELTLDQLVEVSEQVEETGFSPEGVTAAIKKVKKSKTAQEGKGGQDSDPRTKDQGEDLDARRRAWREAQEAQAGGAV